MGSIATKVVEVRGGVEVVVRTLEAADAAALAERDGDSLREDPAGDLRDEPPSVEDRAKRIAEHLEQPGWVMIGAFVGGRLVGRLSFNVGKWRKISHHGTFGIGVASDMRGKGIGREMIVALLDWAAENPGIERVALGCFSTNDAAARLYRKMGFVEHAREPQFFRLGEGVYADDVRMCMWVKPGLAPVGFKTWTRGAR